jgi:hypothetical protein
MNKYVTVGDLIAALQQMPKDAPVFGYSETDECDLLLEVVEFYTPTQEDEEAFAEELKENPEWPWAAPPHYCQGDSYVGDYWRENRKLSPVVYIRESLWEDRHNKLNGIKKDDVICLTADM